MYTRHFVVFVHGRRVLHTFRSNPMNTFRYVDNPKILRTTSRDKPVNLDPPFSLNRNCIVLFCNKSRAEVDSQITAFEDNL